MHLFSASPILDGCNKPQKAPGGGVGFDHDGYGRLGFEGCEASGRLLALQGDAFELADTLRDPRPAAVERLSEMRLDSIHILAEPGDRPRADGR